jgi:uncharacterized protein (DUF1697 family)
MRHIVLLRGINIGPHNRVAMPKLRAALTEAGFDEVRTYVQSGNIVLESRKAAATVAKECRQVIAEEFGLEIDVVTRTRDELAEIVRRNPLGDVATEPKRYQVTFLSEEADPKVIERLAGAAAAEERMEAGGREIYAWHPDGVARSKLWSGLAGKGLGVTATSRNWTTVQALLAMADEA